MKKRQQIEIWLKNRNALTINRNGEKQAAVAMVLREGPGDTEILFITRATHPDDPWSGQIAFPGGRFEPEDDNLCETVIRETLEEINLDLRQHSLMGSLDELAGRRANQPAGIIIACFVYWIEPGSPVTLKPNYEVAKTQWIKLSHLLDKANATELKFEFSEKPFPAIRFPDNDVALWGITLRFIQPLLEELAKPRARSRQAEAGVGEN